MNGTQEVREYPQSLSTPGGADAHPGQPPRPRIRDFGRRSPGLAAFLSIMPGMGQVYIGFYRRGFTYMAIVALTITMLESGIRGLEPLFGFSLAFFWFYNVIDAYRMAKLYNRAGELGQELDLQDVITMPPLGGSLFGGIVLMAVGLLLLLHHKFDISMAWIEEWWPLAPIALGAYLVTKSIKARRGESDL